MVQPIQRVNVDLNSAMLPELDQANELNVSRQALGGRLPISLIWRRRAKHSFQLEITALRT
jgi:hypothetical protein